MSTVVPDFILRVTDANGKPVSGGKMYFFTAGTTSNATVYSDKDLTIPHAQPVVADASGWLPAVYAPNGDYKIRMSDAAGATIREVDYVTVAAAGGALPLSLTVVGKTANYTLVAGDRGRVFECDASGAPGQQIVVTAASDTLGNGWPVWIANSGASGSVVIQPGGGQTVVFGGVAYASYTLTGKDQIVGMVSRGAAGWRIFSVAGGLVSFVDPIVEPGTALTDGATITPDFSQDSTFTVTLGGNRTMAFPTFPAVGQRVRFIISQDGTGGRTLAWNSGYNWVGGFAPTLDGTANNRETFEGRVISASVIDMWKVSAASGRIVQIVNAQTSAQATGSTLIPFDDTIPQNTEGTEFMSLAITPKSTKNKLLIEVTFFASASNASQKWAVALFQDAVANALAAVASSATSAADYYQTTPLTFIMDAGTVAATTFKVRAGCFSAGSVQFNGQASGRLFGAITKSMMKITEYTP